MDAINYLDNFQKAASQLDKKLLKHADVEVATGIYLNAIFLKLYKRSWANPFQDPLIAESRIFFSIWINDNSSEVTEQDLFYNIHALKLRYLKNYSMESRKFADSFRLKFKSYANRWENVNLNFGPLTLMQGNIKVDQENLQQKIIELSYSFLEIEHLIDQTLGEFIKKEQRLKI